mgnify:CR=1 FL=1
MARHLSKASSSEDAYFLRYIGNSKNFALGKIWGTETAVIFTKKEDKFQVLAETKNLSTTYYLSSLSSKDGIWGIFKTKEGASKLYVLKKDLKPLELQLIELKEKEVFKFTQFSYPDIWGAGNYKEGIKTIYALNKAGELEQMSVSSKNKYNQAFLFTFKSGETKLLYNSSSMKGLSTIKDAKKLYEGADNNEYWIVDGQNNLYYYQQYKKKDPVLLGSKGVIEALKIVNKNKAIIQYEKGDAQLLLLDYNKNITQITLPKGLDIKDAQQAWRNKNKTLCYYISLENGLKGLMEESGKIILDPVYESISNKSSYLRLQKDGKFGTADKDGKILIEAKYPFLESFIFNSSIYYIFRTEQGGPFGFMDKNGKVLLKPAYASLSPFQFDRKEEQSYFIFGNPKDDLIGLMDRSGKIIIKPNCKYLKPFKLNPGDKKIYDYFSTKEFKYDNTLDDIGFREVGIIDETGKVIVPDTYSDISYLKGQKPLFLVTNVDNKKGLIDLNGKLVVDASYNYLEAFNITGQKEDLFFFRKTENGKKTGIGCIAASGKVIHPPTLDIARILEYRSGAESFIKLPLYIAGKMDSNNKMKYALFSKGFRPLSDFIFDEYELVDTIITFDPETFEEIVQVVVHQDFMVKKHPNADLLLLNINSKTCLYNFEGKAIIPAVWDEIYTLSGSINYFIVLLDNKWGLVDKFNKTIVPAK